MEATHAFRCECQTHLGHLLVNAAEYCGNHRFFYVLDCRTEFAVGHNLGVVVRVATNLSLEQVRELMGTVGDDGAMADSVDYISQFTDWKTELVY